MFFGKKETESIALEDLEELLESLFERKLGSLGSRAAAIASELAGSKSGFSDECDMLERLEAEPYVEELWSPNIGSIKGQKAIYARTLRQINDRLSLEADEALNTYDRYRAMLQDIGQAKESMLKANADFKLILYCYSKHLNGFKRRFSSMERLESSLRKELDSRSREASEYSETKEAISKLRLMTEELQVLNEGISAVSSSLEGKDSEANPDVHERISKELSGKQEELSAVKTDISRIRSRMDELTLPLERPSKKLDHLSARRRKLHDFIADPLGSIASDEDYDEFRAMLTELKESLDKGTVDVKNRGTALNAIEELSNMDIREKAASLRQSMERKTALEEEIRILTQALADTQDEMKAKERSSRDREGMRQKENETMHSREEAKRKVERLFETYYRKRISIKMG
ncbi:MAG: hypothetical protein KGH69_04870 [Candidatus Micrarchaeota archaeon]|nr:hypothetical protein [Candidatus Micrarchaeota archaeon]MDE1851987.1 hypothetical protein [Candidatus Micrarchaeota archaeon]